MTFGLMGRTAWAAAGTVEIETFSGEGESLGLSRRPKTVKSDAQWKAELPPQSYAVTRQHGTERAYTGATWDHHASGL